MIQSIASAVLHDDLPDTAGVGTGGNSIPTQKPAELTPFDKASDDISQRNGGAAAQ